MKVNLTPVYDGGLGNGKTLGLIILSTDESLENEAATLVVGQDISLLHSRIKAQPDVTPDDLEMMAAELPVAAGLLPDHVAVVGYGCTSGATIIGPDRVVSLVQSVLPGAVVTNPLSAVEAACKRLGVRRIAYISPYVETVTAPMRAHLARAGIDTVCEGSFGVASDRDVARIAEATIEAAVAQVVETSNPDAVFISCTNLRTFSIIDRIEARLGLPVISSNQAMLWQMFRHAGITHVPGPGRLFTM